MPKVTQRNGAEPHNHSRCGPYDDDPVWSVGQKARLTTNGRLRPNTLGGRVFVQAYVGFAVGERGRDITRIDEAVFDETMTKSSTAQWRACSTE